MDQIALTGGIGANDPELFGDLQQSLAWLGSVRWLQVDADEEGMIGRLINRADQGSGAADG